MEVGLKRIVLCPGHQFRPEHAHTAEEELFYVLQGRGPLLQDGEQMPVKAGGVISVRHECGPRLAS